MEENTKPVENVETIPTPSDDASVAETASMMFGLYYPQFKTLVDNLSNNSLRRLIKAMVAVPLEDANVNLKLKEERVAYAICEKLMISKFGLVMHVLWEHEQDLKKQEETNKEEKKENTNG